MTGTRLLGHYTRALLDPLTAKRSPLLIQLLLHWPDIVGPELSRHTKPQTLRPERYPNRVHLTPEHSKEPPPSQGSMILTLLCDPGHILFLSHQTPLIVEKINTFCGYPALSSLTLKRATTPLFTPKDIPPSMPQSPAPQRPRGFYDGLSPPLEAALRALDKSLSA